MLTESKSSEQLKGNIRRRWFSDEYFDLILWQDDGDEILRFELCYGKNADEHAFVWSSKEGYAHLKVDDGEEAPGRYKMSPVLLPDGLFDRQSVAARFCEAGRGIDQKLVKFVFDRLPGCCGKEDG